MVSEPRVHALIPAAGRGLRFGASTPKQYAILCGQPVLAHSIKAVQQHPFVSGVTVALAADDGYYDELIRPVFPQVLTVGGGDTRAQSVLNGLRFIMQHDPACDWVLVHDAARPCLTADDLQDLLDLGMASRSGAILACPVSDTLKQADASGFIESTVDRSRMWAAQTPQLFPLQTLADNLDSALSQGLCPTDEAAAMESAGAQPLLVQSASTNIKITSSTDLALAEFIMNNQAKAG